MSRCFRILLLLTLTASVRSQFFADFFQNLQSYVTNRPTPRQIYHHTTSRTKTEPTRNYYRTTKSEQTTKAYEDSRSDFSTQFSNWDEQEHRRRKTTSKNNNYTTTKPTTTKDTSRRVTDSNKTDEVDNRNKEYDGKINSIYDYYTQKPNYSNNYRPTESADRNNYYTTNNPLVNRPGVRPIVVDNRPPITNRPVTKRPNYGVNPMPIDEDSILFPDDEESPELIIGPDEDDMSDVEKKRYIEVAERMCDKYKELGTRAVQAIPLLPSPEPVNLNVSSCAPTTVPLVVGGKVVGVQEFPHMALLGWRKLQAAGFSWKCGGSLVSEQFVLTAAHCSFQDRDNTVVNGPPRAVQLGSSYLDDPGALVVRVASVIRHPKYKQPRSYYDIALVKMVNAVKFSELIKPACIGVPPAPGKSIIATGWGRTEYGGEQSHELRSVAIPVWPMARCRDVLGVSRRLPDGPLADSQLCAGEEQGGKDTCQGDSGGPAQMQEGCIWRVVAVTSLGRSCGAAETPGLYALVHRAFVASQIFANQYGSSQNYGNNDSQDSNNQFGNRNQGNAQWPSSNNYNNQDYGNDRQDGYNNAQGTTPRRPASNNDNYNNQNYGNDRQQGTTTRRPAINNDNYNQNYGNDRQQGTTTRRPAINDDNYNQNYGNDRQQGITTRRPAINNDNYNQNYGNDRQQGTTTRRPAINNDNYNQNYGNDRQQGTTTRRPAINDDNYNQNYGNDRQQGTTTRRPAINNENYNQNYGNDRQQGTTTRRPAINNENYNQNYGNDRQQGTTTRRPAINNENYNQNYGNDRQQGTTTRRPAINNDNYNQNYGNDRQQGTTTRRPAINNENYNQNYGNDRQQGTTTRRPAINNENYNNQNYGNDRQQGTTNRRPAINNENYNYNRPEASVTQRLTGNTGNSYTNGQDNYNNDRPNSNVNYNIPENNPTVYDTRRPDRNVAGHVYNNGQNFETDSTNLDYGNINNRHFNNYNQQQTQRPQFENSNYDTQRPYRISNSGIINNNYNRQQNSQYEYTTRKSIRINNGNRGIISGYANNNRRTDHEIYTVNTPWWY